MLVLLVKRLALAVPALFGVSLVSFLLLNVLPGDPLAGVVGPGSTQAERDALAHQLGLDRSLPGQYLVWLKGVFHGDLGFSLPRGRPVAELISTAFPATMILAAAAAVLGLGIGILLGSLAARSAHRWPDRVVSSGAVLGLSVPNYWASILLIILFSSTLGWFPPSGMHGAAGGFADLVQHLVLPALAASCVTAGLSAKMTRASLLEKLGEDFVQTLRAQGVRNWRILVHVAKNAAPPILAVSGLQIGYLLGGSVLVETIFNWPGLGQLMYHAIAERDLRVVQGSVLVIAVTFVVITLVVDLLQFAFNPRLRRGVRS
ncbi:ABC transporter permease [Amycolatopsis halotolerans]|uniref:ABC transporter permease n=1 Tax=Amycolatopsis halotolerans TaxID=330083 RepID=A0ABV7QCW1_9PSEU